MKITMEQVKKMNAQLFNGFHLDIERCVVWSEKNAVKEIELSDGRVLKAEISYREVYANDSKPYWRREVIGVRPTMTLSVWKPGSTPGIWVSHGMGTEIGITADVYPRRTWKDLAALTADWTDSDILDIARKSIPYLEREEIA